MNRLGQNDFLCPGYSLTRVVNGVFVAKMRSLARPATIALSQAQKVLSGNGTLLTSR